MEAWFWHVLETVGQDISLLNQTSLLLHQTVFQTSSNRNIYILQVRMGRLRRTREFTARCGLFPHRTEHFRMAWPQCLPDRKQVEKQCGKLYVSNL